MNLVTQLPAAVLGAMLLLAGAPAHANPCNPCAEKPTNACNPCSPDKPANACNPCGGAMNACNPCGGAMNACNPCGGAMNACNPCGGAMGPVDPALFTMPTDAELAKGKIKRGKKLWADKSLSGNSATSCATCHTPMNGGPYAMMLPSFAETYPHPVKMAKMRADVDQVDAAEMVNFCMIVPMKADPLAWDSKQLADLTAYVVSLQPGYTPTATPMANPCMGKNPCGM